MDYRLEQWINRFAGRSAGLDATMVHVAQWSEVLFFGIVVTWYLYGWASGSIPDRRGAVTAGLAAALALLVNQLIIVFWKRPRPFVSHPGTVHVLMAHSKDPSFPSDHAAPAMAIAVALLMVHRRLGVLAVAAALLVGLSRVFCGVHYPADVIAGFVIGAGCAVWLSTTLSPDIDRLRALGDRIITTLHLPLPGTN